MPEPLDFAVARHMRAIADELSSLADNLIGNGTQPEEAARLLHASQHTLYGLAASLEARE